MSNEISSLYTHRSFVSGRAALASSRSRAVRNALKRYTNGTAPLAEIRIEHKVNNEWVLDEAGQKLFDSKAREVTPKAPVVREKKAKDAPVKVNTYQSTIRHLKNVCAVVLTHETIGEATEEALETAMQDVMELINAHRAMRAKDAEPKEVTEARDTVTAELGKGTQK